MAVGVTGLTVHTQNGSGTWKDYGTGGGSTSTTATFLSGTTSRGRKFTGSKGFAFEVNASGMSLSNTTILLRFLVNGGLAATLAGGGGSIRLEDTSGNTSDWYIAGSDTYNGGWFEAVIDTANAESANSGTAANLSLIQYVGILVNASSSSGGDPNVYVDEILSWANTGLTVTGNTTNMFDELATWDETSLYGIITRRGGVVFCKAPLVLSPDASNHASTDEVVVFEEPIYEDGTNVDSAVTIAGFGSGDADTITFTRLVAICEDNGDITGTNADKKMDFTSAGDIVADTSTFRGFNGTVMHLGGTGNSYDDCTFQGCSQIVDTGAVVRRGFVRDTAAAAAESALLWTGSSDWEDTQFIMGSTNSHAMEVEAAGTDAWNGFTFTGYNATAGPTSVGNEVLNNNSTGAVTVNASNVTGTISFYNRGVGSSTTINNNVTGTFTPLIAGTEVRVYTAGTSTELDGVESSGTSFGASIAGSTSVDYVIHHNEYEYIRVEGFTWPTSNQGIGVAQRPDRNYLNP